MGIKKIPLKNENENLHRLGEISGKNISDKKLISYV